MLIPGWARGAGGAARPAAGGRARQLASDARRSDDAPKLVRSDIAHEIARRGGADNVVVFDYTGQVARRQVAGRDREALEARSGRGGDSDSARRACRIAPAARACAASRCTNRHGALREAALGGDVHRRRHRAAAGRAGTHARFYGSFPRKIRHYAIERGAISIEHAIRSSTSLPAQIMGLQDRGLIREVWRPTSWSSTSTTIRDKATFFEPHQYSEGIDSRLRERRRRGRRPGS